MGVSNYDNEARGRRYDARFTLVTPEGVESFLRQYNEMTSLRTLGDYDAAALLLDMDSAMELADLTDLQRRVIDLIVLKDATQAEAGEMIGTSQQNASKHLRAALVKIAEIYESWAWRGEGYGIPDILRHQFETEGTETDD